MFVAVVTAFVLLSTFVYYLLQPDKRLTNLLATVPSPKRVPLFGNVLMLRNGHEWFLQILEFSRTYLSQGLFVLWIAKKPLCFITKSDYIETLLSSTLHIEKSDEYDYFHPWLGTGLLTSKGAKWRSRRKMLTPTFHFNILHDFIHVFNKQSKILVDKLDGKVGKGPFDVFPDITHCALDIICESAMGKSVDAQSTDSEYVRAVHRMSYFVDSRTRKPWFWLDFLYNMFGDGKEMAQKLKILHGFTISVIEDRLKNFDEKQANFIHNELMGETSSATGRKNKMAFLDMLLYMSENLTKLSMEDIREEVDTFMFEGHDTTAAAISWAVHLLGANPDVQAKLQEELDSIFGDDDRDPTMEDLKNMKYLECCIKEALRLYPSVPFFGRKLSEDIHFGGYTVPKDVTVLIITVAVHRNSEIYPEPMAFKPERFLPENCRNRHPYSFIPFSAGSRNCIGQKFALLESKSVLSHIFRKHCIKSMQSLPELRPVGDLILRPEKGLFIEITPRLTTSS